MHDPRCCAGDGPARTDAGVRSDDEQVRSLCIDNITDLLHVMRTYLARRPQKAANYHSAVGSCCCPPVSTPSVSSPAGAGFNR